MSTIDAAGSEDDARDALSRQLTCIASIRHTRKLTVSVTGGAKLLAEIIRELDVRGVKMDDIGLRRPTLDDVFLSLTGHVAEMKPEENGATADAPAQDRKQKKEAAK